MKTAIYIVIGLIVAVLLVIAAGIYKFNYLSGQPGYDVDGNRIDINNFDDCVRAGYPVMESYPEQCSDGEQTFVNGGEIIADNDFGPISVEPDGGIGDGALPLDELLDFEAQAGKQIEVSMNLDFNGLSVEQARELADSNDIPFRIVERDGELYAITMDYRPGRINAVVTNGVVTSYTVEGAEQK